MKINSVYLYAAFLDRCVRDHWDVRYSFGSFNEIIAIYVLYELIKRRSDHVLGHFSKDEQASF